VFFGIINNFWSFVWFFWFIVVILYKTDIDMRYDFFDAIKKQADKNLPVF